MAAETGLQIDGRIYEVPDIASFTMDEAQVLYDYSGLSLEDFAPEDGEDEDTHLDRLQRLTRNPGFRKTLLHVAYQRGNQKVPAAAVAKLVGAANWLEPFATMGDPDDEAGDDQVPPVSTSKPTGSSPNGLLETGSSTASLSETPGNGSTNDSDEPDGQRSSTTGSRSGTSSISVREISAA